MRERWAEDMQARARAYWTVERTRGMFGSKTLILPPAEHGPLLRSMGLLKADASMAPESVRKYMQISHMLTMLEPQMKDLSSTRPVVRVLDLACGNSYLTLTMATSFKHRLAHPAEVLGVDRNERLIDACRERSWRLGLDATLKFETSWIDRLDVSAAWCRAFGGSVEPEIDLLVALHACDTATDDAIALGLAMGVPAMAIVPCCQGELAKAWSQLEPGSGPMAPLWSWPHMRREAAATMTDALRALLLRGCGYDAAPIEFVPSSHTPKNTMIRATKVSDGDARSFEAYVSLREALGGVRLHLERVLPQAHVRNLVEAGGLADVG